MVRHPTPEEAEKFEAAEQALLTSEGIAAEARLVDLERLGGQSRVLIAGDGQPVLFVPGTMTTGAVFAGLVGRLPDFQCIMVDRPGTGLSPLLPSPPTDLAAQQRVADDLLVDVLDGLGIEHANVVPTSLGGWTAFRSVAAHPDRFLRLSALAFQVGARIEDAPMSMRMPSPPDWMLPQRVKAGRGLVRTMLKSAGMRRAITTGRFSDELLDYMVSMIRHTPTFRNEGLYNPRPAGVLGPVDAVRHTPELLAKVQLPVHLFWGTNDLFGGATSAEEFASLLPDAELQMVDQAGHAPWLDEPELAAESVRRHFST